MTNYHDQEYSLLRANDHLRFREEKIDRLVEELRQTVGDLEQCLSYGADAAEKMPLVRRANTLLKRLTEERRSIPIRDRNTFSMSLIDSAIHIITLFKKVADSDKTFPGQLIMDAKKSTVDLLLETFPGTTYEQLIHKIKDYEWLLKERRLPSQRFSKYAQKPIFSIEELDLHASKNTKSILDLSNEIAMRSPSGYLHPLDEGNQRFFYERFVEIDRISVGEEVCAPRLP